MADKTLCEKLMEAPYIIHGFVNDEPKCNYEKYLTELINCSDQFMQKSQGESFRWVEKQDHGECDAVCDSYSIDYKLLATRSTLQGLRETAGKIRKIADGAIAFGIGRWKHGIFKYYRTVPALSKCSVEDYFRIADNPNGIIEEEVSIILKSLRVKKNLLLFYPYIMMFSEPHSFEDGCKSITEAFNEDLYNICNYRKREVPCYDTYLCTEYEQKLLIFEDEDGHWILKDIVEMSASETYMDLYYTYGNYGFNH